MAPLVLSLFILRDNTSALEYQNSTNIQFTFNPTLTISVSDNLTIDNLSPGTYSDSNIVDVNVSTNTVAGYSLTATVGNSISAGSGGSNSTDLIHSTYNDNKFSSITTNKADLANFSENTWGYSYSTNNGTNWISGSIGYTNPGYNGLPLDANATTSELGKGGTTLVDTYSSANSSNIKFKIGARASSTQAAGTYTNTVNFYAISKVPPVSISDAFAAANKTKTPSGYYKMQDMSASICSMVQTIDEDSQTELVDIRDGKTYWVAKLQDGNCWMTQNLDLELTTAGVYNSVTGMTTPLTSANTNLTIAGSGAYVNGYEENNDLITWTPAATATTANILVPNTDNTSVTGNWQSSYTEPYSAEGGDVYVYTSGNANPDTIYTSLSDCTNAGHNAGECKHYHRGNYYNPTVAWASNDSSSLTTLHNTENSICPAGWRLPQDEGNYITEYGSLLYDAGITKAKLANGEDYVDNGSNAIRTAPLYFVRAGNIGYNNTGLLTGLSNSGAYWAGIVYNAEKSVRLASNATVIYTFGISFGSGTINDPSRHRALPIRCLAEHGNSISNISDLTYLQDFASLSGNELTSVKNSMADDMNYTLTDKRDGNEYTVKKINDQIWMTQNLRITGVVPANGSNFTGDEFNVSKYSLDTNDGSYANHCDSANGYNYACAKDSGDTTTGVWYNYYAATAGTIATDSNADRATQDICPAGWHIPTGPNTIKGTDINKLVGNTTSGSQEVTSGIIAFNAVPGGYYREGSISSPLGSLYWSANASFYASRYDLSYNSSTNYFNGTADLYRHRGAFLRCVKK